MTLKLQYGTDPELFVKYGDRFLSAHKLLPGNKQQPHLVEGGAVQVDGVAAEFNTMPVSTADDFVEVINLVRNQMLKIIQDNAEKDGMEGVTLEAVPTAWFDSQYFLLLPEEVKALGCTPDFNAWTGGKNYPPSTDEPFRTGGCHLHISWQEQTVDPTDPGHIETCRNITRQLDTILFPKSKVWDTDEDRRKLYGNIGAFRPKFYGCEYRVLSNACLKSDELIRKVFTTMDYAVRLLLEDGVKAWEDGRWENPYKVAA